MPLNANALTTLADVKAELGLTGTVDDAYLESQINFVSTAIEDFIGCKLGYQSGKVEKIKGYGGTRIRVSLTPVVVLTDVTIENPLGIQATLDVDDMEIENDGFEGFIYYRSGWPWTAPRPKGSITRDPFPGHEESTIRVTYDGGYVLPANQPGTFPQADLPLSIQRAATLSVSTVYNRRGSDRAIKSESLMSYRVDYGTQQNPSGFSDEVASLLMPYRCIRGA